MAAGKKISRNQEDQSYGIFRSKFRFEQSKRMYDVVRHREESKPSKPQNSYPGFCDTFFRVLAYPACSRDDTHIMLGWFVKQAGLF